MPRLGALAAAGRQRGGSRCVPLLALLVALAGCRLGGDSAGGDSRSPLRPATPSTDSASLEIYWARYAWGDEQLNSKVWNEIDESQIPAPTRRALADNGFRAGVVGTIMPPAIARVLELEEEAAEDQEPDQAKAQEMAQLLAEPQVTRRRRQLRPGTRLEVQASEQVERVPLLVSRRGELGGRTYRSAQAMYAVEIEPSPARTIRLKLTPEVQFGPPQLKYSTSGDGVLRQQALRDREVYSDLGLEVSLAPGEMLVVAGLAEATGRLGNFFHTAEDTRGKEQKVIVIRLAQVPDSQAFDEQESIWPL